MTVFVHKIAAKNLCTIYKAAGKNGLFVGRCVVDG